MNLNALDLSRFQFATTSIFHFFFVPFTVGLALTIALLQTLAFATARGNKQHADQPGAETPVSAIYEDLTKFFGHLFLINFAVGVVTGIVQEFQFGTNWSGFANFVGDIFGVPLALEVLMAFFLESTFLGIWWFGRERLPKWVNLASIWLVGIGSSISAFWIILANAWMQHPVGYRIVNGQAQLTDFGAVVMNPKAWLWFGHIWFAGICIAAFFVLGVSAYHLKRNPARPGERPNRARRTFGVAMKLGVAIATFGILGTLGIGHVQGQAALRDQPMKFAAMEGLWESTSGSTPESLVALPSNVRGRNLLNIEVPYVGSLLAYNRPSGGVKGILELQRESVARYGPGNYVPSVWPVYWSFRVMVGLGVLMLGVAFWGLWLWRKDRLENRWFLLVLPLMIPVPHLANFSGFITTEMGRQPWIVQGLLLTRNAVSPLPGPVVLLSLAAFWLVYVVLLGLDIFLLTRTARAGLHEPEVEAIGLPAPDYGATTTPEYR